MIDLAKSTASLVLIELVAHLESLEALAAGKLGTEIKRTPLLDVIFHHRGKAVLWMRPQSGLNVSLESLQF